MSPENKETTKLNQLDTAALIAHCREIIAVLGSIPFVLQSLPIVLRLISHEKSQLQISEDIPIVLALTLIYLAFHFDIKGGEIEVLQRELRNGEPSTNADDVSYSDL